jgi:hypothetical protein
LSKIHPVESSLVLTCVFNGMSVFC